MSWKTGLEGKPGFPSIHHPGPPTRKACFPGSGRRAISLCTLCPPRGEGVGASKEGACLVMGQDVGALKPGAQASAWCKASTRPVEASFQLGPVPASGPAVEGKRPLPPPSFWRKEKPSPGNSHFQPPNLPPPAPKPASALTAWYNGIGTLSSWQNHPGLPMHPLALPGSQASLSSGSFLRLSKGLLSSPA